MPVGRKSAVADAINSGWGNIMSQRLGDLESRRNTYAKLAEQAAALQVKAADPSVDEITRQSLNQNANALLSAGQGMIRTYVKPTGEIAETEAAQDTEEMMSEKFKNQQAYQNAVANFNAGLYKNITLPTGTTLQAEYETQTQPIRQQVVADFDKARRAIEDEYNVLKPTQSLAEIMNTYTTLNPTATQEEKAKYQESANRALRNKLATELESIKTRLSSEQSATEQAKLSEWLQKNNFYDTYKQYIEGED